MFRAVTVARDYGSGGASVAQRLADRLGWKLLDRCLIEKIAEAVQVEPGVAAKYDERLDPWFNRLVKVFGEFSGYLPGPRPDFFDADVMASQTRHLIEEAAGIGNCVIVGRGSQCILHERSDIFHAFIYAPRGERVRRVQSRNPGLTEEEAERNLDAHDRERVAYVRRYHGQDRSSRYLYHLMISSSLGEEVVVSSILNAMGVPPGKPAATKQSGRREG